MLADQISTINHKELIQEQNAFFDAADMARIIERNEKDFYYSMSMEPVSSNRVLCCAVMCCIELY